MSTMSGWKYFKRNGEQTHLTECTDLSIEEWDLLSNIADAQETKLSQSQSCNNRETVDCKNDNCSDTSTLIDEGEEEAADLSCLEDTPPSSMKIKRKSHRKRSDEAKNKRSEKAKRRREKAKLIAKPKTDVSLDLSPTIEKAVEFKVDKYLNDRSKPFVQNMHRVVQAAAVNAKRKVETRGRRALMAAKHQKVKNVKWLKDKKIEQEHAISDLSVMRTGLRLAAGSTIEVESNRMIGRAVATIANKESKSFRNASRKDAQRRRYYGHMEAAKRQKNSGK